jgi:hypothetical protein
MRYHEPVRINGKFQCAVEITGFAVPVNILIPGRHDRIQTIGCSPVHNASRDHFASDGLMSEEQYALSVKNWRV